MEAHSKLDIRVQKWIYKQGWSALREIQEKAIQPILSRDRDVLISASTAAGKTEAFFLPACSAAVQQQQGFSILYVSPLKALINDQYRRLEELCSMLDMAVTPWHGDVLQSKKKKMQDKPSGILLITPESLEALLVLKTDWARESFAKLQYICIDEFHAFIGTERGQQLLSLLNRLEHLLKRLENPIPRVALSATLGELEKVPLSLRPNQSLECVTITSSKQQSSLSLEVKGFIDPVEQTGKGISAEYQVCEEIYQRCRGDSNLVFANGRERTERIAVRLADFSKHNSIPNEFFPHHGSLSKELRGELETRLQKETIPTTAICTMTLELGIDIGKVNSVIQVTAPHSVSSLRQRLGRSGRRNAPAILRMFIIEKELSSKSNIIDSVRLQLFQSLAMIRLLVVDKWFEPADTKQMHLSTFLHQTLAVIAQWGSIQVEQLYILLCKQGPFKKINTRHIKQLLSHMAKTQLLKQLHSGEIVLGIKGEQIVNHYTFPAVFSTPQEYRIATDSKTLGTVQVNFLVIEVKHIVFAGKYWKIIDIDDTRKVILVTPSEGGKAPKFSSGGFTINDVIRQEMFKIYCSGDYLISDDDKKIDFADFSNKTARQLLQEGIAVFNKADLRNQSIKQIGNDCYLFAWLGDQTVNTLTTMLIQGDFQAKHFAGVVTIKDTTTDKVKEYLIGLANGACPSETQLASAVPKIYKLKEKYDAHIPEPLLSEYYGRKNFDSLSAKNWILNKI